MTPLIEGAAVASLAIEAPSPLTAIVQMKILPKQIRMLIPCAWHGNQSRDAAHESTCCAIVLSASVLPLASSIYAKLSRPPELSPQIRRVCRLPFRVYRVDRLQGRFVDVLRSSGRLGEWSRDRAEGGLIRSVPPATIQRAVRDKESTFQKSTDTASIASRARIVGKYRLGTVLGKGGMSTVYAADHVRLGRRFALKFLRAERSSSVRSFCRLEREARLLSRLQHENVVALFDVDVDSELGPYLVLEYLTGRTLRHELNITGVLPLGRALEITKQIAMGLSSAHAAGIVHRDLKPENIMLTSHADGRLLVKLLDFGVARLDEASDEYLTATGAAVGTAPYMSPEQAAGRKNADPRSDVYSLAVMLYEVLSGIRPYDGGSYNATLFRILNERHRPLTELRPDLPNWISAGIEHALSKEAADRPPDVVSFMTALRVPTSAPPLLLSDSTPECHTTLDESNTRAGTFDSTRLPLARHRKRSRLALCLGLFVMIFVAISGWHHASAIADRRGAVVVLPPLLSPSERRAAAGSGASAIPLVNTPDAALQEHAVSRSTISRPNAFRDEAILSASASSSSVVVPSSDVTARAKSTPNAGRTYEMRGYIVENPYGIQERSSDE